MRVASAETEATLTAQGSKATMPCLGDHLMALCSQSPRESSHGGHAAPLVGTAVAEQL